MASIYNAVTRTPSARRFARSYPLDANQNASLERQSQQDVTSALYLETSVGRAVVNAEVRLVIGQGLRVEPAPENIPQIKLEDRQAFVRAVGTLWRMWCNSPDGDYYGRNTFYQQQQIAFREVVSAGDVLSHVVFVKEKDGSVGLRHQLISGRYVKAPAGQQDTKSQTAGVVFDPKTGVEKGFLIAQTDENRYDAYTSVQVSKTDREGRVVYRLVHIGDVTPNQARGVSIFGPVKDSIINLTGFIDAYVSKAKAQAVFAIGFTHDSPVDGQSALEAIKEASDDSPGDGGESTSGSVDFSQTGVVFDMPVGEKPVTIESDAPSVAFSDFVDALCKIICAGCGIPVEVAFSSYNSNYSASRATIKDAEAGLSIFREEFARQFCQPVYEAFVDILVAKGLVSAPGYLEDPMLRKAWLAATWTGPTVTDIDPLKEVNALVEAHAHGLVSKERICKTLFGTDYAEVAEIIRQEKDMEKALGLSEEVNGGNQARQGKQGAPAKEDEDGNGEEDEEGEDE